MDKFKMIEDFLRERKESEIVIDFEGDQEECLKFIDKFVERGEGNAKTAWNRERYSTYGLTYLSFELEPGDDYCSMYRDSSHSTIESYKREYTDSYYTTYDKFFNIQKGVKRKLEL